VAYRDDLESRRRLELLPTRPASPCDARWEYHTLGSGGARWCGLCGATVYDPTSLSPSEIRALLPDEGEGRRQRTLYRRTDGRLLDADCLLGSGRRRRRNVRWGAFALGLVAALGAAVAPERCPSMRTDRAPAADVQHDLPLHVVRGEWRGNVDRGYVRCVALGGRLRVLPCFDGARVHHCKCAPGDPLCSCL
jgi:hypothetical protein